MDKDNCKDCIYAQVADVFEDGNPEIYCTCIQTVWCETDEDINNASDSVTVASNCPYFINYGYLFQPEGVFEHWGINECCDTCAHNNKDCKQKSDSYYGKVFYEYKSFRSICPDYSTNQYRIDKRGNCVIPSETFNRLLMDYERMRVARAYERDCRLKCEAKLQQARADLNDAKFQNATREESDLENQLRNLRKQIAQRTGVLNVTKAKIKEQEDRLKNHEDSLKAREDNLKAIEDNIGTEKLRLKMREQELDKEVIKRKAKLDKQEASLKAKEVSLQARGARIDKVLKENSGNELLLFFKSELPDVYKSLNKEFKRRMDND